MIQKNMQKRNELSFQGGREIHDVINGVARQPAKVKGKTVSIFHDITKRRVKLDA